VEAEHRERFAKRSDWAGGASETGFVWLAKPAAEGLLRLKGFGGFSFCFFFFPLLVDHLEDLQALR